MKKKHRVLYKKIAIVVFIIILILVFRGVSGAYQSLQTAQDRQAIEHEKISTIDERIQYLEDKIEYLDTQEGLEQELLETFPVKRPGEQVIILVERDDSGSGFLEIQEENTSWWQFWR